MNGAGWRLAALLNPTRVRWQLAAGLLLCGLAPHVGAATLLASAIDKAGAPMVDVVVYAISTESKTVPAIPTDAVTIAQDHQQFSPYVTAVRTGTAVRFPNYDHIEHHVKSFSPAKEFEIKVYDSGTPPPVLFDKPGIVVVYCLLHEWMRAYVLVLETNYFGKTDASGTASISGLKEGSYEIRAWHPDMGTVKPALLQTINISDRTAAQVKFSFDFVPRKRRAPK